MLITGSCHCGNISFRLNWSPEPAKIPARACTCSFCLKHGGVWTSCPTGELAISLREPAQVSRYSFGTRTAEFLICARCGVVPVVTSLINDHLYAVVSVNAFDEVDPAMILSAPTTFDGEDQAARLARRAQNWIATVSISSGA
jgi:hypothetical protein